MPWKGRRETRAFPVPTSSTGSSLLVHRQVANPAVGVHSQRKKPFGWSVRLSPIPHGPGYRLLGRDRFSDTQDSLRHIQRASLPLAVQSTQKKRKVCKQPSNICFSSRFRSINLVSLIGRIQWCVTSSQSDNRGATSLAGRRCFLWGGWGKTESNMGRGLSMQGLLPGRGTHKRWP